MKKIKISILIILIFLTGATSAMAKEMPNTPSLTSDMVPVKWSAENKAWVTTAERDLDWYNYEKKKWANIMLKDGLTYYESGNSGTKVIAGENIERGKIIATEGSMFVWIPRFTYKISEGDILIKWSANISDNTEGGYSAHPAFCLEGYKGGNTSDKVNYSQGKLTENELTGFWMAKYLVSKNDEKKIQIKPNIRPETNKSIGGAYDDCIGMKQSYTNISLMSVHLTKATEWGAVSYLTKAIGSVPEKHIYTMSSPYILNKSHSTTHNEYGIYDMYATQNEYIAAITDKEDIYSTTIVNAGENMLKEDNRKYVDFVDIGNIDEFYGLAFTETSDFNEELLREYPDSSSPYFIKNGQSGLWGYSKTMGEQGSITYRPVIGISNFHVSENSSIFNTEAQVIAGDNLRVDVNFSLNKAWKFPISEEIISDGKINTDIESDFLALLNLKYISGNNVLTINDPKLHASLAGIIKNNQECTDVGPETEFEANDKCTVKIKIGGIIEENGEETPLFLDLEGLEHKIIIDDIKVVETETGNILNVAKISNNKIDLKIHDSGDIVPKLSDVYLSSVPEKTVYIENEQLLLKSGELTLCYKDVSGERNFISKIPIKKEYIVDFEKATILTPELSQENKNIKIVYQGIEVCQDSTIYDKAKSYNITINKDTRYTVTTQMVPNGEEKCNAYLNGAGKYESGSTVTLTAKTCDGYKFKSWILEDALVSTPLYSFIMPEKNVTVTANILKAIPLEETATCKREFEKGDKFSFGTGKIKANYSEMTSEDVTEKVTSIPTKGEILDKTGTFEVTIIYGGTTLKYNITVTNKKHNLILRTTTGGVIKEGISTLASMEDEAEYKVSIPWGTIRNISAVADSGYVFKSWEVTAENVISDLTNSDISVTMPEKSVIITAEFAKIYTTIYDSNKPSTASGNVVGITETSSHIYDFAKKLNKNNYALDGWHFAGWATQPTGEVVFQDKENVINLTETPNGTVRLYAKLMENVNYTIKYNANDKTGGSTPSSTHIYDTPKALTANGFSRAYTVTYVPNGGTYEASLTALNTTATYTFKNWKDNATGNLYDNQQGVVNLTSINGSTINLYAQWNSASVILPSLTRTGYIFDGWYTASSGGTLAGMGCDIYTPTSSTTLYAKWKAKTYTVTYYGNGETGGSTARSTHEYDVSQKLTANGFNREYIVTYVPNGGTYKTPLTATNTTAKYIFNKWTRNQNGSGENYSDRQSVTNLTSTNGENVDLYAQWLPTPNTREVTLPVLTREGYSFDGWFYGSTKIGKGGEKYKPTSSITLKAKWTDIIAPTCIITSDPSISPTNASSITYTFEWSETLKSGTFTTADITVVGGTKGVFTEKTPNKVYTLVVINDGSCTQTVKIPKNKCQDIALNYNDVEVSKEMVIDRSRPNVSTIAVTSPTTGIYSPSSVITLAATWDENVVVTTAPNLTIKFGDGTVRTAMYYSISGKTLIYKYTLVNGDNGVLSTVDYTGGTVKDIVGNIGTASNKTISGNIITAASIYTITLNQQGGTGGTETIFEKYGIGVYKEAACNTLMSTLENPIIEPEKPNYSFDGYYTLEDGEGIKMINESGYITDELTGNQYLENTVLYAKWKSNILIDVATAGEYLRYTPASKMCTVYSFESGYKYDQTFNSSPGHYYGGDSYLWRVFKNENGVLEIIPDRGRSGQAGVGGIGGLILQGTTGYSNGISIIKRICDLNLDYTYASSVRMFGYNNAQISSVSTSSMAYGNTLYPYTDNYNVSDLNRFVSLGMNSVSGWLPSRYSTYNSGYDPLYAFGIRQFSYLGNNLDIITFCSLLCIKSDNKPYSTDDGWRADIYPIVTLRPTIKINEGTGTSENPYIIIP